MPREILLGVETHADPSTIVEALTTREGLSSFWTPDVVAEPKVGTEARFGFRAAPMPLRMRIDRIEASEVAWTCLGDFPYWEGTTVTWSLSDEPEHGGTRILFRQVGFPDEQPAWEVGTVAHSWSTILDRLKTLVETGVSEPALR